MLLLFVLLLIITEDNFVISKTRVLKNDLLGFKYTRYTPDRRCGSQRMLKSAIPEDGIGIGSDNQGDQIGSSPLKMRMRGLHRRIET